MAGSGADLFLVNNASDVVQVGSTHGADTVQSSVSYALPTNVGTLILTGSANISATGNSGAGTVIGNAGADSLTAGSGAETLISGSGVDTLIGSTGNDTFVVDNASDVVTDTSATAVNNLQTFVNYTLPTDVNALVLTGEANIVGTGNAASDTLTGGIGNDTLIAGSSVSTLIGGFGNTTFVLNNALDVVQDAFASSINTIDSSVSFTLPTNVNVLAFTGTSALSGTANSAADNAHRVNSGADTLTGGSGNDTFIINSASDVIQDTSATATNTVRSRPVSFTLVSNANTLVLTGSTNLTGTANGANDTLAANSGVDTLKGGAGSDTFVISNAADVVQDTSATTTNTLESSVNYTLPTDVNVLLLTGQANVEGPGNGAADTLTAGAGNDTLVAGAGVATLIGGSENTTFVLNNASDIVQDAYSYPINTIQSSVSYTLPTNVTVLTLMGTANLAATSNTGNDTLSSNSGTDTLTGGAGATTFVVNNAADKVQDSIASASVVDSSVSFTLPTNINSLLFTGSANLTGTSNSGNDTLASNAGVDTLNGTTGNDTFIVNNASDVVTGQFGHREQHSPGVGELLPPNQHQHVDSHRYSKHQRHGQCRKRHTLTSGAGIDTLIAGSSADTLIGGTGNATFVVNNSADVVQNTNTTANDTIQSSVTFTIPPSISVHFS